jgi:hypothetical protein
MNPLVQRSILDLMCLCLPINSQQITKNDKINLIVVAIHVILRRDMSLNRRIYAWFMGISPTSSGGGGGGGGGGNSKNSNNTGGSTTTGTKSGGETNNVTSSDMGGDDLLVTSNNEETYFHVHTKGLLVTAIKVLLNSRRDATLVQYLFNDEPNGLITGMQLQAGSNQIWVRSHLYKYIVTK